MEAPGADVHVMRESASKDQDVSTDERDARGTPPDDEQNTYCQEHHSNHDDENEHQAYCASSCLPLILVRSGQLFRSTRRVDRNGRNVRFDIIYAALQHRASVKNNGKPLPSMLPCSWTSVPRSRKISCSS